MTGLAIGGHIGFAKESSGGTPVAATNYIEALSEDLSTAFDRYEVKAIVGRFEEPDDARGVKRIGGALGFAADPTNIGTFLLGGMGVNSITTVSTSALWTHSFTMRKTDWDNKFAQQPFTFEIFRDVTSSQQYTGVCVSALELSVTPNQGLQVSATLVGKSETDIAKTTPTFVTSPVNVFAFDTASVSLAGAAATLVEEFTLTLDNQLEGIPTLNSSLLIDKIRRSGASTVRFTGSLAFEDLNEYLKFKANSEQQLRINFTRADSFSLLIDIPRALYTAFPLGMTGGGRQVVAFEGRGRYHQGSGHAVNIKLTNTTSFY